MDEPGFDTDFLRASRVAVWGLGLMGGSLALALKGKCSGMVGIDSDPGAVAQAMRRGLVDAAYTVEEVYAAPEAALAGVDLLVLAVPVRAILAVLADLPDLCHAPLMVMDLGSTKAQVAAAMAALPARFDPVGGHPMCGKEKSSLVHAEAAVYQKAPFALLAVDRTTPRARALAENLARAVGACPLWVDAEEHDRWVAATSHVPFLLSAALAQATPAEAAPLVGPGFRGAARLAGSSPRMMADILATNAGNVRASLQAVKAQLALLEDLLNREDYEALAQHFAAAGEHYRGLSG